ncbi:MAG: hypothetical protein ACE5GY_09710 [Thermodesulfobacteriota bacterium]
MKEREAVERVVGRVYRDRLERTGRLPAPEQVRRIEKEVREAARSVEAKERVR